VPSTWPRMLPFLRLVLSHSHAFFPATGPFSDLTRVGQSGCGSNIPRFAYTWLATLNPFRLAHISMIFRRSGDEYESPVAGGPSPGRIVCRFCGFGVEWLGLATTPAGRRMPDARSHGSRLDHACGRERCSLGPVGRSGPKSRARGFGSLLPRGWIRASCGFDRLDFQQRRVWPPPSMAGFPASNWVYVSTVHPSGFGWRRSRRLHSKSE
jgi:hypothetical protein